MPAVVVAVTAVMVLATPLAGARPLAGHGQASAVVPDGWHYVRGGDWPHPPAPFAVVQPDGRTAYRTEFLPFATAGEVTLTHPAQIVERIGLHQSNHEGARDLTTVDTAAPSVVLPSRGRESGLASAADVVVAPDTEIRAPVTGTVIRAGTYVLYCDYSDDFAVIAPDHQPEWEVKVLHIDGVTVSAGDRVRAGQTVIAPRATVLPFGSQVDDATADPPWPHAHLEVIDPSIPNVPNGGSGSDC